MTYSNILFLAPGVILGWNSADQIGLDRMAANHPCFKFILPLISISFPEPSCLLVSTKTRSSGIVNKVVPRAHASFAFKF